MDKKVVLVTGSSKGLGRDTIKLFASKGYNVVINYNHSFKEANELAKYIDENYDVEYLLIKCDISNADEVIEMKNKILEKFNKLDILVNNAGISIDKDLDDMNIIDYKKIIDTNMLGTFNTSRILGSLMYENKAGSIINISSTDSIDTYYGYGLMYDSTKAAINSLTHNFSKIFSPYVRVNAVAPGWINTSMNEKMDEEFRKDQEDKIYIKRFAETREIANIIYFLASDESSYINNEIIRVDGGCNHE